ncbi:MAG: 6-pyruvoyl-tetrahydropterin synthase-related protein [Anaerolineae bacterium]
MRKAALYRLLPLIVVVGATLLASLPLLRPGLPETHDGLFHYYRLLALHEALQNGCFYPRWFPQFAYGYGQPVLSFYGPGLYWLGESIRLLGSSPLMALKGSIFLATLVSAAATYGLAHSYARTWPAAFAAAAYVLFPYRLANLYVRGAYAEHWGLALLPLLLFLVERAGPRPRRGALLAATVAWSMVILTHNLSAMMLVPVWLLYLLFVYRKRLSSIVVMVATLPMGMALSAFYWLPIPWEARFVGLGNTFSTDAWQRYLVPFLETISRPLVYSYFPRQGVTHDYPLGLAQVAWAGLALVVVSIALMRGRLRERRLWFIALLLVVPWFLQLRESEPLWRILSPLGYLQFPWRLLGLAGLGWALLLGLGLEAGARLLCAGDRLTATACVTLLAVVAATSLLALPNNSIPVVAGPDWEQQMWQHDREIGQVGATWTAEYVPIWVTVDRSAMPGDPVASDRPPNYALPPGSEVWMKATGQTVDVLQMNLPEPARLSWHAFYFPGWRAYLDGELTTVEPFTDLGLLSLLVPAGEHELALVFSATPLRNAGRILSVLAVMTLALLAFGGRGNLSSSPSLRQRGAKNGVCARRASPFLFWEGSWRDRLPRLGAAIVLALGMWLITACRPVAAPVIGLWAPFEDKLALVGWHTDGATTRPGGTIGIELYWLALSTPQENYKAFVHVVAADGRVVAQSDGDLVGGFTRTRRLVGGEVTQDRRWLSLPMDLAPGSYDLYTGLYRWPEISNLRVSAGEQQGAERLFLGRLDVTP